MYLGWPALEILSKGPDIQQNGQLFLFRKCCLEWCQYIEGKVVRDKSQGIIKHSMSLSTTINRLFSLATVQIPVVVNLPDTAML